MDLTQLARLLAVLGVVLLVCAGAVYIFSRLDIPIGKLPGDIVISRDNFTCAIPLVSGLLFSIILTILVNLLILFTKK